MSQNRTIIKRLPLSSAEDDFISRAGDTGPRTLAPWMREQLIEAASRTLLARLDERFEGLYGATTGPLLIERDEVSALLLLSDALDRDEPRAHDTLQLIRENGHIAGESIGWRPVLMTWATFINLLTGEEIPAQQFIRHAYMPLPTDQSYTYVRGDLDKLPEWGTVPRSLFVYTDDSLTKGVRWVPARLAEQ